MKKFFILFFAVIAIVVGGSFVIQMFSKSGENPLMAKAMHIYMDFNDIRVSRDRHQIVHDDAIPEEYKNMTFGFSPNEYDGASAAKLYNDNCLSCHGEKADGNGELSNSMMPRPTNLAFIANRHIATDDFMIWTMSLGGAPLNSGMPAFKDTLDKKQMWLITEYLKRL